MLAQCSAETEVSRQHCSPQAEGGGGRQGGWRQRRREAGREGGRQGGKEGGRREEGRGNDQPVFVEVPADLPVACEVSKTPPLDCQ